VDAQVGQGRGSRLAPGAGSPEGTVPVQGSLGRRARYGSATQMDGEPPRTVGNRHVGPPARQERSRAEDSRAVLLVPGPRTHDEAPGAGGEPEPMTNNDLVDRLRTFSAAVRIPSDQGELVERVTSFAK